MSLEEFLQILVSPTDGNQLGSVLYDFVGQDLANPGGGANDEDFFVGEGHFGVSNEEVECTEKPSNSAQLAQLQEPIYRKTSMLICQRS